MTVPPAGKTDKTDKTPAALRSRRREVAYAKAVRIAVDAIAEVKDFRPETVADLFNQLRAGGVLSPGDLERIEAALSPVKRDRGRPIGSGAMHERRIVRYALYRVFSCRLPNYRNPASQHRFTKADAIAQAMKQCGLKRVCTYEAVAAEIRRQKPVIQKSLDEARAIAEPFLATMAAMQATITEGFAAIAATPDGAKLLEPFAIAAVGTFARKLDDNY
jgi:hypothetical protein